MKSLPLPLAMAKIWIEVKIRCNLVLELIDAKLSRMRKRSEIKTRMNVPSRKRDPTSMWHPRYHNVAKVVVTRMLTEKQHARNTDSWFAPIHEMYGQLEYSELMRGR